MLGVKGCEVSTGPTTVKKAILRRSLLSVINSATYAGPGCLGRRPASNQIELDAASKTINEAKAMGNSFSATSAANRFMPQRPDHVIRNPPEWFFQVFNNGHFITMKSPNELRRAASVTALFASRAARSSATRGAAWRCFEPNDGGQSKRDP